MADLVVGPSIKGLVKLADTITRAVGKLYEPIHIRRMADAEGYKKLALGRADAQAKLEKQAILAMDPMSSAVAENVPLLQRAAERVTYQQARGQENLEAILDSAANQFSEEDIVTAKSVDETWANRFFSAATEVAHHEMQAVWGKLLSGEIREPGTFSLRALDVLRNLTTQEAINFQKMCSASLRDNCIYKVSNAMEGFEALGISLEEFLALRAAGLFSEADNLSIKTHAPFYSKYGDWHVIADLKDGETAVLPLLVAMPSYVMTAVGAELAILVERQPNWQYLQLLAPIFSARRLQLKVAFGVTILDNFVSYESVVEVPFLHDAPGWRPQFNL